MPQLLVAPKGGRETPSSRYRVHDLVPLLSELGWTIHMLTPSMQRRGRFGSLIRDLSLAARSHDVLLVQRPGRRREESLILRLALLRTRNLVIDVDDPMEEVALSGWAVREAKLAVVGSNALAHRYARRIDHVVVVPTSLEMDAYALARTRHDPPIVGWIGDGPAYAEPLTRMIAAVASSPGNWRLKVVGTKGLADLETMLRKAAGEIPLELVSSIDWENESVVAHTVSEFDIGLAPFRDREGTSFKTIQYLAAGTVPLVEAGGEAERHVRTALGANALVVPVDSQSAVSEALAQLADFGERSRLSRLCSVEARRLFSTQAAAAKVDSALRQVLGIV
jgi:hypothetical protein